MTVKKIILILLAVTFLSNTQNSDLVNEIRSDFQQIESEEDIEKILAYKVKGLDDEEDELINAYKAAGTCMMANYVFSPKSKLKYFKQGKGELEELILTNKDVEKVYLRLLIQLNIPKFLNYHGDIEADIYYLQEHMAESSIETSFKSRMIENLLSVAKKQDYKEGLSEVEVEENR
ncbi:hypothetical protein [Lutimonas sp.]|uniref:hypothetical protein n=1 Tax=Lutimonas sp. TaxID=1872403 RepID=UPI003D9B0E2B